MKKFLFGFLFFLFLGIFIFCIVRNTHHFSNCNSPTKILVLKSLRKLYLIENNKITYFFDIDLGGQPIGHKQFRGDLKTPVGCYYISEKKEDSVAYRALRISYPNFWDTLHARLYLKSPGGDIMVHGITTDPTHPTYARHQSGEIYPGMDWTSGCIAMRSNNDMQKLWDLVNVGIPIELRD